MLFLGVDLGSTTVKYVLLDDSGAVLAKNYVQYVRRFAEFLVNFSLYLESYL